MLSSQRIGPSSRKSAELLGMSGIDSTGIHGHDGVSFISSIHDLFDLAVRNVRLPDGMIKRSSDNTGARS